MIDLLFRAFYRCAYRAMRLYWSVFHPRMHGALVAIWQEGGLLLVRTSYAAYWSLPGGYVKRGETGAEAASRELREELGLRVAPGELAQILDLRHRWEGKRERVEVFELTAPGRVEPRIDRREVVAARFFPPAEALRLELLPAVREVIARRDRTGHRDA